MSDRDERLYSLDRLEVLIRQEMAIIRARLSTALDELYQSEEREKESELETSIAQLMDRYDELNRELIVLEARRRKRDREAK